MDLYSRPSPASLQVKRGRAANTVGRQPFADLVTANLRKAQRRYSEDALKVLQSATLPVLIPRLNQRTRCAELPWVKESGVT